MGSVWTFDGIGIRAHAAVGGREEARGPLGDNFDYTTDDDTFGRDTFEHAEGEIGAIALSIALKKAGLSHADVDFLCSGDLQNQCVASSDGLSGFGIPTVGLYGACSTFVEGILTASAILSGTGATRAAVVTTSHNCAAERQFRMPLEYGGQRKPTAQWTATAGGACILERGCADVRVTGGLCGRPIDGGVCDSGNMGAAMAPAAADTLLRYFAQTRERVTDFDAIVTGDLAREGSAILHELLTPHLGDAFAERHRDCGCLLYDFEKQDVHSGASGCGCVASVACAHVFRALGDGKWRRVLLLATGALMSPTSIGQGGDIIGIAPLVRLEAIR